MIPGVETESAEAKAEREKREADAKRVAELAERQMLAKVNAAKLQVADLLRKIVVDELATGVDAFTQRRGKVPMAQAQCKVLRPNPVLPGDDPSKPWLPFIVVETDLHTAVSVATADSIIAFAPDLPFLNAPWFPAACTTILVLTAIMRLPDRAPAPVVSIKREDERIDAKPAADGPGAP